MAESLLVWCIGGGKSRYKWISLYLAGLSHKLSLMSESDKLDAQRTPNVLLNDSSCDALKIAGIAYCATL